ncbi:hypothetical protein ABH940_001187 [Streptacidiphilus sp. BW17]
MPGLIENFHDYPDGEVHRGALASSSIRQPRRPGIAVSRRGLTPRTGTGVRTAPGICESAAVALDWYRPMTRLRGHDK